MTAEDGLDAYYNTQKYCYLLLIGNGGSSIWPVFSQSMEFLDGKEHPLDRWSRRVGESLAAEFAARVLFPFDGPPYWPFLRWTGQAEQLPASPLGLRLHPEFGLWHAYRFALLLQQPLKLPLSAPTDLCASCSDKACLSACPVTAFTEDHYQVDPCIDYLQRMDNASCNKSGCLARHACPYGQAYRYQPEHAQFHMREFIASQQHARRGQNKPAT